MRGGVCVLRARGEVVMCCGLRAFDQTSQSPNSMHRFFDRLVLIFREHGFSFLYLENIPA